MTEPAPITDRLRSIIERIERLEEEKKAIADDIREVYAEAKGSGFSVKALRAIVKMRKQDADQRREEEAVLETYMLALGMLSDTPLGEAAIEQERRRTRRAARTRESMEDVAAMAQEAADLGLTSQEAAADTKRMAEQITQHFAAAKASHKRVEDIAASPAVRRAFKKLGTPTELTDDERQKGYTAAFIGPDGTRMAMGVGTQR